MTKQAQRTMQNVFNPVEGVELAENALAPLNCIYEDQEHGIFLYNGDCFEVLDQIAEKYPMAAST